MNIVNIQVSRFLYAAAVFEQNYLEKENSQNLAALTLKLK